MMPKKNPDQITLLSNDGEYEVQQILSRKNTKNGLKYLVKWKGFQLDECTWEPLNHLYNSMEFVQSYERKMLQRKDKKECQSYQEKYNKQNIVNEKKLSFQEHLIFPEPKNIKFEGKKQSIEGNENKKKKKISKKYCKHKKGLKGKDKEIKGSQFCILIDEDQNSAEKEKIPIRQRRDKEQEQGEQKQEEQKIQDLLQLSQFNIQEGNNEIENGINMFNEIDDEQFIPSFSLNLTEMQQQEGNRLTLQNLNPDFHQQLNDQKQYDRRKLCRLRSGENIKILEPKNPILKNKQLAINKIVNLEGKWLVEVKLRGVSHGFAYFETLKKLNIMKVLDFLVELIPKE